MKLNIDDLLAEQDGDAVLTVHYRPEVHGETGTDEAGDGVVTQDPEDAEYYAVVTCGEETLAFGSGETVADALAVLSPPNATESPF